MSSARPREPASRVAPHGKRAIRCEHPPHLGEESIERKPVQRLRNGDEIDRGTLESARIRERDAVRHARMRCRVRDLLGARVRRDDTIEPLRERNGCLAVARRAIPRRASMLGKRRDEVEQRVRISSAGTSAYCAAADAEK